MLVCWFLFLSFSSHPLFLLYSFIQTTMATPERPTQLQESESNLQGRVAEPSGTDNIELSSGVI
jgi:hypothetical protein